MTTVGHPVALVTGGGRGIGVGICRALAGAGFGVAVNYRGSKEAAEQTRDDCLAAGAPWATAVQGDVARLDDHEPLVEAVYQQTGRIDLLVNNAGISSPQRGDLLDVTPQAWDQVLGTNLRGPFFLTQAVLRRMLAADAPVTEGVPRAVINISSISAYVASKARSEYCISKAGLSMLTQLLAHRLAEAGILVFEVRPGVIRSDMTQGAIEKYDRLIAQGLSPIRRWGTPEDVGRAVVSLATGGIPFSTGLVVDVDGGYHSRHL